MGSCAAFAANLPLSKLIVPCDRINLGILQRSVYANGPKLASRLRTIRRAKPWDIDTRWTRLSLSVANAPTGRCQSEREADPNLRAVFEGETSSKMTVKPSHQHISRIMLAEDDDSMRGFLQRALERAGHEVVAFENGADAYERLTEEPFCLLLTDIVMPRMDGIELARRASEIHPDLKIMFITGFAAVTLNNDAAAPKEARVLSKPFHLKDLVNEVERLLNE